MIEDDLSRVEESATKSTYELGVGFERCEDKGEKSAPKFIPSSNYHQEEEALKPIKTHYPSNPKPSFNRKREVRKKPPRRLLFACFVVVLVTWMSFASITRELRRGTFIMLETHIAMCSLIFHLVLIPVPRLISFMDIIITHMVLVHKRIASYQDALVMPHILIVVIVSHLCTVFLLEDLTLTLSPDSWMVHVFPIVVHDPLVQMVRCKIL
jgi:hypothetical protein